MRPGGCKTLGKSDCNEKTPDTPCIFCAHKHIAAAKELYDLEPGYKDINKSHAIGQLILAAWHYEKEHLNLALRCREIWLRMERLEDIGCLLNELQRAAWKLVVRETEQTMENDGLIDESTQL